MPHKYFIQLLGRSTFEVETDIPLAVGEGLVYEGQCYDITFIQRGLIAIPGHPWTFGKPVVFCGLPRSGRPA